MNAKKDTSNTAKLATRVEALEAALEAAESQAEEAKAASLRALADLENFRRRQGQEQAKWSSLAVSDFLKSVLPSFLELSLGASHSSDEAVVQVVEKFFDSLRKQGLNPISPKAGDPIDPQAHEVLMAEEGKAGTVVRCLEIGWQFNDSVIQPAKVSGAQS